MLFLTHQTVNSVYEYNISSCLLMSINLLSVNFRFDVFGLFFLAQTTINTILRGNVFGDRTVCR